jgi:SAM-dependent methyltransferase
MRWCLLEKLLEHPLTRGLELDRPETTALRRQILREKPFLKRIYEEWYEQIAAHLPAGEGAIVELGSGAGFLADRIPGLITSERFVLPELSLVLDAHQLPFRGKSLRGIAMTDVLHHLSEPRRFFAEAARCVRGGGAVVMIEPWVSSWSGWIYRRLLDEPFDPHAVDWEAPARGPLAGANVALPWILFERDRERFEREFPQWRLTTLRPMMPFRYLLSGGISMRSLMPAASFEFWRGFEVLLRPFDRSLAMFVHVVLERTGRPA